MQWLPYGRKVGFLILLTQQTVAPAQEWQRCHPLKRLIMQVMWLDQREIRSAAAKRHLGPPLRVAFLDGAHINRDTRQSTCSTSGRFLPCKIPSVTSRMVWNGLFRVHD
ncbi:hypothetical protein LX32DRAFT_646786 [Colletotrichum zoysiae]|uniref:Secreted protein n=1 Tax=Colletotrichum zoysiae TaxID=1216348 RepID=A0AAD9LWM1_9PEZI|nr:hypothetical protein LX32DRAFT_646786 [Colletotrichum zoysiae]